MSFEFRRKATVSSVFLADPNMTVATECEVKIR